MITPVDIVHSFYAEPERGDAPRALALMADDIEWTTMWYCQVKECGPQAVAEDGRFNESLQQPRIVYRPET